MRKGRRNTSSCAFSACSCEIRDSSSLLTGVLDCDLLQLHRGDEVGLLFASKQVGGIQSRFSVWVCLWRYGVIDSDSRCLDGLLQRGRELGNWLEKLEWKSCALIPFPDS